MSIFAEVTEASPIEVFFMNSKYQAETAPQKVNLTIGAYRTEEGKNWVLPVVRQAEKQLADDDSLDHEYLPVLGLEKFSRAASELVLGSDNAALRDGRAFGVQCLSGTGSLRAGADFLHRLLKLDTVYVSKPTWGNHHLLFNHANYKSINTYRYWDAVNCRVDIEGFCADLEAAPERAVIVLHGCAHNPTGMDPSRDEWKRIAEIIKRKNLFTFFDIAYQGFASGDPDADAWAVRYFVDQGLEMVIAQSFAKNFGLYNERVGNLTFVVSDPKTVTPIRSQISLVIRANWSNPPAHGARVVALILTTPEMRKEWFDSIQAMSSRIKSMRQALRSRLEELKTPGTWDHVTKQIGMFSYTGLTRKLKRGTYRRSTSGVVVFAAQQVDHLVKVHKVFLLSDGRINICGLNTKNVDYVAKAINDAVQNVQSNL